MKIRKLILPEVTSAQLNIALIADKLNELIGAMNGELPTPIIQETCDHSNSYEMRPNLRRCKTCKKVYKV